MLSMLLFLTMSSFAEQTADEILKKADDIRNPLESFHMIVEVKDSDTDKPTTVFDVKTKGKDRTLIETLAPARDVKRNLLMIEENMWLYIPNINQTVRMSLNQKLTGQAANGDISRMKWHGDYDAKIEKADAKQWVLFLTANRKGLTYEKIRLFVERKTNRPINAEYLSLENEPLKKVTFGEYEKLAKADRPTLIKIMDAKSEKYFSTIKIKKLEEATYKTSLFQQTNLK